MPSCHGTSVPTYTISRPLASVVFSHVVESLRDSNSSFGETAPRESPSVARYTPRMSELQFFDPKQPFSVAYKTLPHWSQAGTVCFITWRTADSLPAELQERITAARQEVLQRHGLNPHADWKSQLAKLPAVDRGRIRWSLFSKWDEELDRGAGACLLGQPEHSQI